MPANPQCACSRRRIAGIVPMLVPGRHHEHTALTKQSRPLWYGERHSTELRTRDAGNAVMTREWLVQEGVGRAPQRNRITILAQLIEDEQLRLRCHRVAQAGIEIGKMGGVRFGLRQLIESQPREEEAEYERTRAIITEHACDLPLENSRRAQPVAHDIL